MRLTHNYPARTLLGFAALLTFGCGESTGPVTSTEPLPPTESPSSTGSIEIAVSTLNTLGPVDHTGYSVTLNGQLSRGIAARAGVKFLDVPPGPHVVQLHGLAPNCRVVGTNPRWVDVTTGRTPSLVSFGVWCDVSGDGDGAGDWDY